MTTRSEREKAQKLNEQHQAILSKMLREEDNKYCADCEAKGPRWASWNLGVFICIRCAGIHRNLGVHISRVKSVNLDQWTPEQIQSVQSMGNTKARQLYEAHLPDNFRRPQTDQAVEFFIRDKYEKKKYYDKNAVTDSFKEREKKKEEKKKEKETDKGNKPTVFDKKREDIQIDSRASPKKSAEPAIDLLGLDAPAVNTTSSGAGSGSAAPISDDLDIFGPMVSNPLPSSTNTNQVNSAKAAGSTPAGPGVGATSGTAGTAGAAPVQSDLDLFSENSSNKAEDSTKKPLSKDSILSLYGSSAVPQQPAQAAMFIGTSQMPFPAQPQANFPAFPAMGGPMPPTTMMGAVMGQGGAMMGQNTGMMVGMTMPNGFMGNAPAGVMGVAPGMMGAQAGAMPAGVVPPQNMYAMQPGQQTQWSMGQMNQQMSGLNLNGAPMAFGQPGTAMGGWVGPPSGQTLSTQLWK
ncbi:stromal membrane-associated protein 1 isoform X3 [Pangasianodon hypophthalmus]|uniref:stromal membrane-associated protein 1 isoform X3 n=1 Tax=Pangasianodon hypophthalmus TaxID=310915 RepID=UPI000EFE261A|nr:stromal membrane-associated protein 1 isoform X3 [Pangasianodon hypophthalmus]